MIKGKNILVTGSAGFIGMHTALRLVKEGYNVVGIDNLNTYYSVDLKLARLKEQGIPIKDIEYNKILSGIEGIRFVQLDITDTNHLKTLFQNEKFDYVIHLAAQAGVRYSIENPFAYVDSNIKGFLSIIDNCKNYKIKHLIFASSSSVYGNNTKVPFHELDSTDQPVSFYAASKKANEAMAYSYASVHLLPVTGLRFFTVYGPYGRPDMAPFKFTEKIFKGEPIEVYNDGNLSRDFTYIDDIVKGLMLLLNRPPDGLPPYEIYNIGRGEPISLEDFISEIEIATGKKAMRNNLPMQAGDVEKTFADISELLKRTGFSPSISLKEGVSKFVKWYFKKKYHK